MSIPESIWRPCGPRGAAPERLAHRQPETERPGVNEQAFENVLVTAQVSPAQTEPCLSDVSGLFVVVPQNGGVGGCGVGFKALA